MGCTSSRIDASYEEAAMINGDNKLYFEGYEVQKLYNEFKQKAVDGKVPLKAFKRIAKHLPLIYHKNEEVIAFYNSFVHEDHLELRFLATLAVILCRGTIPAKVDVLYETWLSGDAINQEHFAAMLDLMFDLAVEHLPKLASKPEPSNNYSINDFNSFLDRARLGKGISKETILKAVFEKQPVNKSAIVAWAHIGENNGWLNSRFIRSGLKKAGKRLLHKKKKAEKSSERGEVGASLEVSVGKGSVEVTVSEEHHHHHRSHDGEASKEHSKEVLAE